MLYAPPKTLLSVTKHLNNRGHASSRKERKRERESEKGRYRHRDCWLDSHQPYRSAALTRCHPWERDEDDDVDRRNVVRLSVTETVKRKKPFKDVLRWREHRGF